MKNWKNLGLCFVAALLLVLVAAPKANAATSGIYTYNISNGKATITACSMNVSGAITIPEKLNGYPVTSIGNGAFRNRSSLTSVSIPNSVTSIGSYAFQDCSNLTSVTIPDGVTSIGYCAFSGCGRLTSVTIPDSVTSIGGGAFENCSSLTGIWVDSVNQYYCSDKYGVLFDKAMTTLIVAPGAIAEYTIPDGVVSLANNAFWGCTNLTSITIPDSVTVINMESFCDCTNLAVVTIGDGVTIIDDFAFGDCTNLAVVTIGDSVTTIGDCAFYNCSSLTTISIPDSVTTIDRDAFDGCSQLNYTEYGNCCYLGNSDNPYYALIKVMSTSVSTVSIHKNTRVIASGAFSNCTNLTNVNIPDSVTSIGYDAFFGCSSLSSVSIPDSVTSIGYSVFDGCSQLNYTEYGNCCYLGNSDNPYCALIKVMSTSVSTVSIHKNTRVIASDAFSNCTNLTNVNIPDSVTSIGNGAFYNCSSLSSVSIPDSVVSIGKYAFEDCSNLTSVTIPDSVVSIGNYAFYDCTSLKNVYYTGTQSQWNSIIIGNANSCLTGAVIHYNYEVHVHKYTNYISNNDATCAADGTKTAKCDGCDATDTQPEVGSMLGHSFTNYVSNNDFTYLSDGTKTAKCDRCNAVDTVTDTDSRLTGMIVTKLPDVCNYLVGEKLSLTGLEFTVSSVNGVQTTFSANSLTEVTADMTSDGKKTVTVSYRGCTAKFEVYVHNGIQVDQEETVPTSKYPQSTHNYTDNLSQTKTFTWPGAKKLILTFSSSTKVENGLDYIYLYNGSDVQIAKYTGTEAAGKSVTVTGDTFKIKLTSDGSVNYYGYAFSSIVAIKTIDEMYHPPVVTFFGTAPDCTKPGCTDETCCDICGMMLTESEEIAALGHSFTDYLSCDSDVIAGGAEIAKCDRCDATDTRKAQCGDGLFWVLKEDGVLVVSGIGYMYDYSFESDTAENNSPWASWKSQILRVEVASGVTSVGTNAFRALGELTEVSLPQTLRIVGNHAFRDCTALQELSLPEGITDIGSYAFCGCAALKEVTVPNSLTSLGTNAFRGCESLQTVTLGTGLSSVPEGAFYMCGQLTAVTLPKNIASVASNGFYGCYALKTVYYSGSSSQWGRLQVSSGNTKLIEATVNYSHTHNYTLLPSATVAATCCEVGYTEYTCVYGETYRVYTPMLGHSLSSQETVVLPSCTQQGYTTISCTRCGESFIYGYIDALGHDNEENIVLQAPTCTEDGIIGSRCRNCGRGEQTGTVDATGHSPVLIPAKDATCTESGNTVGTQCQYCKIPFVQSQTIAPLGHNFTNYISNNDATVDADGTKTAICTSCGETDTVIDEGTRLLPEGNAILRQPVDVTVDSGNDVQFRVEVQGEVVSYKWQYRKIYTWFNTTMDGYDTDTLTVSAKGSRNGYDYRCIVTFADGTVLVSEPAELTVKTILTITYHPNDQLVVDGFKGQFTVKASGEGLKYVWEYRRPDSTKWSETLMEGNNKETVMIQATENRDGYMYRCKVTDVTGNVAYTEVATMRVLSVAQQPQNVFTAPGKAVTFTVAGNVSEGYKYQWQYYNPSTGRWIDTSSTGYNTATLTVSATLKRNGYQYRCILKGSKDSQVTSVPATLHVGEPVEITAQPKSITVEQGTKNTILTVKATNVYSYQWKYSDNGTAWYNTSGDGNKTATLTAKVKNGRMYRCHIKGLDGTEHITEIATIAVY